MSKLEEKFFFNEENLKEAEIILKKYPDKRKQSGLIPLLTLAQEQNNGWLSKDAIEYVAKFLYLHPMQVYEVASFYTMFNLKPVGKYHIQICTTTPCWLRGAEEIKEACKKKLNIGMNEVTSDNKFSISEVECLAACVNAPVIQISNKNYYENLTPESVLELIDKMK